MTSAVSPDDRLRGPTEYAAKRPRRRRWARPSNLFSPRFWSMASELMRFYRRAKVDISPTDPRPDFSLGDYLDAEGYSQGVPERAPVASRPRDLVGAAGRDPRLSRPAPSCVALKTTACCSSRRARSVAHGRGRRAGPMCGSSTARADKVRLSRGAKTRASHGRRGRSDGCLRPRGALDEVVIAVAYRGSGAALLDDPTTDERACWAPSATPRILRAGGADGRGPDAQAQVAVAGLELRRPPGPYRRLFGPTG